MHTLNAPGGKKGVGIGERVHKLGETKNSPPKSKGRCWCQRKKPGEKEGLLKDSKTRAGSKRGRKKVRNGGCIADTQLFRKKKRRSYYMYEGGKIRPRWQGKEEGETSEPKKEGLVTGKRPGSEFPLLAGNWNNKLGLNEI